jgi:A/G-specific adenine glycosylase
MPVFIQGIPGTGTYFQSHLTTSMNMRIENRHQPRIPPKNPKFMILVTDPKRRDRFRKKLMEWYRANARDLPWRHTRDPYAIWVSEIMLQQTQVATVIPYYLRFLKRFPTLRSLADTPLDEILPLWSGLGYYQRIRNFHAAVQTVMNRCGGSVPRSEDELLSLPGVGRYTAGAILSLAYNLPQPLVDGNVTRVLCRLSAMADDPRKAAISRILWDLSASLVQGDSPADFNQALMELGATICIPVRPLCASCPVQRFCQGYSRKLVDKIPPQARPRPIEKLILAMALVAGTGDRLLIVKRNHPRLMTGLWEFPVIDCAEQADGDPSVIASRFRSKWGLRLAGLEPIGRVSHAITYRRIRLNVYAARLRGAIPKALRSASSARWMQPSERFCYGMSSLSLKALRLLQGGSRDT